MCAHVCACKCASVCVNVNVGGKVFVRENKLDIKRTDSSAELFKSIHSCTVAALARTRTHTYTNTLTYINSLVAKRHMR